MAAPTEAHGRLAHWCKQTIRNMQALGFGHQRGEPYIMCDGGIVLTKSNGPFTDMDTEKWIDLNVEAHGHKIAGAGYVYGNTVPGDIAYDLSVDAVLDTLPQAHRESA